MVQLVLNSIWINRIYIELMKNCKTSEIQKIVHWKKLKSKMTRNKNNNDVIKYGFWMKFIAYFWVQISFLACKNSELYYEVHK